ncbi:MAG TPA: iron-sulfur cluster assembly accessory protein [Thermoplasmata archaeon]|nr:iron-sulfur cluster assembly accessory protein [Thermoplasmata archaeon]
MAALPVSMAIRVTDAAQRKIRELLEREGPAGRPLRLGVVRTHCMGGRGHAYGLGVSTDEVDGDTSHEVGGIKVLVDPTSATLLEDVEIDYVDGFRGAGFQVRNSKAVGKCPCGHHDLFE